jgi:hypothetical protein
MPNYLAEADWKDQLKKNKLLSGTGISEALRDLAKAKKDGDALTYGKAANAVIKKATDAQKKFLADKASVAYMKEIVKAAQGLISGEVAERGSMELLHGMLDVLEKGLNGAKTPEALVKLRQTVRAPSAALGKLPRLSAQSKKLGEVSKDEWFSDITDKNLAAKKKEIQDIIDACRG